MQEVLKLRITQTPGRDGTRCWDREFVRRICGVIAAKRGPKTSAGKAAVRHNAIQHGIFSDSPVIDGLETEEEWQRHLKGTLESLGPANYIQTLLAERIALILSRTASRGQI